MSCANLEKWPVEYAAWSRIKQVCSNLNHPKSHLYGGAGIQVCTRWQRSFDAFLNDMGPRPSALHSLDRWPDNDGDYAPENCRWAIQKEQQRNRRDNHLITFKGKTQCLAAWAQDYSLEQPTLRRRLKVGWSISEALTAPVRAGGWATGMVR